MSVENSPPARSDISSGFQRSAQDIITEVHHSLRPFRCRHVDFATKAAVVSRHHCDMHGRAVSIRTSCTAVYGRNVNMSRVYTSIQRQAYMNRRARWLSVCPVPTMALCCARMSASGCDFLDTAQERGPLRSATTAAAVQTLCECVHDVEALARFPFFAHCVSSSRHQGVAHNDSPGRGAVRKMLAESTVAVFCTQALS